MEYEQMFELLDRLFPEETKRLILVARKCGLPPSEANEMVQDAWLALWRRPEVAATGNEARIRAWLRCVVRRKAVSAWLSRCRHPVQSLDALAEGALLAAKESTAEAEHERLEQWDTTFKDFEQHDEEDARLLRDYYSPGHTAREVAARWGMSEAALYSKVARLVKKLRKWAASVSATSDRS